MTVYHISNRSMQKDRIRLQGLHGAHLHPNSALPIGGEAHVEGMYGSREDPGDSRGVTFPSTGL